MREPLYRQALRQSWQLAWQHKLLWLFGLLAAFLGQMGLMDLFGKIASSVSNFGFFPYWLTLPRAAKQMAGGGFSLPPDALAWLVWLIVFLAGIGLALVFASVVSQGALIRAAADWSKHQRLPVVSEAWQAGVKHFGRLFFINLIKKAVLVVLALFVGWAAVAVILQAAAWEIGLFLLLFVLAALVGMVVSFLTVYAAAYVVVEEYSLGRAWGAAWRLFTSHWLVSVEVGLIVLLLNLAVAAIVLFGFLVFFFPMLLMWFLAVVIGSSWLWLAGIAVGVLFFTLFIMLTGAVFSVFTISVWTYLFMKMHRPGITSRLLHLFKK